MSDEEAKVTAPQNPGDPGYEPPAILSELDGEGGTKFTLGEDGEEFATLGEAEEARAELLQQHTDATAEAETTDEE